MLPIIVYIIGFVYAVLGVYAISLNRKGTINRLFLMMMSTMAVWSFTYSVALAAHTAEESATWRCLAVFGWGVFYSFFLHLALALVKSSLLDKRITLFIIYLPAAINVVLYAPFGLVGLKHYKMVQTEFGWINILPTTIGGYLLNLYYLTFGVASIVLLMRWLKTVESNIFLKWDAIKFKLSFLFSLFFGLATDVLPDILGIKFFPKMAIASYIVPALTLFLALKEFGLFLEREKTEPVFTTYGRFMASDRTELFRVVAYILMASGALSFFIRFFIMREPLIIELLLALPLILIGVFAGFIPAITENQSKQNAIFLSVSVVGTSFLVLRSFETAGVTIWSVYILFFLLTVILGGKIHAFVFAVMSISMQIVFAITQTETTVTVGITDYVTRVAIIALSYTITFFLTTVQAGRIEKYEKAALEQEILERISSSFISFSTENAEDKIKEMFKMSVDILDFDYAYLFEVGSDCKSTTIVSSYANHAEDEDSYSHHPGAGIYYVASAMLESLITHRRLIVCDDVSGISVRKHEVARNYFISKGINSFAAVPAIIDERIHGIFLVEYRGRAEVRAWENRLSILRILANVLADARKKILYEEKLHEFAYFDESTKMANKNMLKKTLESVLQDGEESEKLAILDIEIENLKMINDTFGHDVGEKAVIKSASILEGLFRDSIIVSRIAAKEFIVVLPYCGDRNKIKSRAEEVIDVFSQPLSTETGIESLFVFTNIGISLYPEDGKDVDTLLEGAELAVNEAGDSEGKIVFYNPEIKNHITETALLTNRLFRSLENDEFYLEFQPQINTVTGKVAGVESLLRLVPEDGKMIGPSRFIPILESTGLIYDVGYWVLRESVMTHQRLISKGFPPLRFSVNVSAVQFKRPDFADTVSKIIEEGKIDLRYIELELTESALSENLSDTAEKISELKKLGVSVAIDDFGKGHSSLHRLEAISFDRIKIDKSIIDNIDLERGENIVTETVISLAKAFKARTTAEGVEKKGQMIFLKELGCDEIQGYYFSKPLPIEALEEFLEKNI